MQNVTLIGIGLGKNSFHVHCIDAEAICEAAPRHSMRFVTPRTKDQQPGFCGITRMWWPAHWRTNWRESPGR